MSTFPHMQPKDTGYIEVITGCMFSGKTEELIRRLKRAIIAKQNVIIFKPKIDDRYSDSDIVSHSEQQLPSISVTDIGEIVKPSLCVQVIGIDEAQFFSTDIVNVCNLLANEGKRVIVAGLDQDYRGLPFGPMPLLMAEAEYVTKTLAICSVCGNPADRTQRKVANKESILIGSEDLYEARCRKCHFIPSEDSLL